MLWVSLSSFRNTLFQRDLGAILTAYGLTRRLSRATGIDPKTDVEGLMVTAEDIFDWHSFRIVASYDSGAVTQVGPRDAGIAASGNDCP